MNFKKCMYFVEGRCEKQLIDALKAEPRLLVPGKVTLHNIIQDEIPRRTVNMILPGTTVVFVYDTDVRKTDVLMKNIHRIQNYVGEVRILHLAQVLNFEDEIVRATDVKRPQELTKSTGVSNFKTDFCRMKVADCRNALERHHLDISMLWIREPPETFSFVRQGGEELKI